MKKNISGGEKIVKNASLMNKATIEGHKFVKGTKIFMTTDDYVGEFDITEESLDSATHFRRLMGRHGQGDIILTLAHLQTEFALGNIKIIDKNGNLVGINLDEGKAV